MMEIRINTAPKARNFDRLIARIPEIHNLSEKKHNLHHLGRKILVVGARPNQRLGE
jgi:hypothetical protein